jgi:hypothetical protein
MNDPRTCEHAQARGFGAMGQTAVCTKPTGKCECGLAMKPKPLHESMEPLELEPATPPTIRPYLATDEGNTPD